MSHAWGAPRNWGAKLWLTLQPKWDLWYTLRARGRRSSVKALQRMAAQTAS